MLKELREKRDLAAKAYRDKADVLNKATTPATAEDDAMLARMRDDIEAVDVQIRAAEAEADDAVKEMQERLDKMDTAFKEMRIDPMAIENSDPVVDDSYRAWMETGEASPEMREAMTTGTGSTGGYLIPDKFDTKLREAKIGGCAIMDLATKTKWDADAVFPSVTAFGATSLVTEGSAKTAVVPTFAQNELTGYQAMYALDIPMPLLRKSAFDIESRVAGWWAKSDAKCMEPYFAVGTGESQPTGIADAATAGTDTAANSAIAGDDIVAWYYDLPEAYRPFATWVFADSTIALIRKIKNPVETSGAQQYLWMPGLGGTPDTLMGRPIRASLGMTTFAAGATVGVFGDIAEFQIVEFGAPSMIRDPYTLAKYAQVSFIGFRMYDSDLPMAEAVITCPIAS